ncbi:MAG: family 78 glycoside hydrolase catalytic domain [Firmicutes bacterium]|nr:family 78 glycoside hydrolase catalytic domain [Bacillota bacterium]
MPNGQDTVVLNQAHWIWAKESHSDQYVRFYDAFFCRRKAVAKMTISVDGNYIAYLNGAAAAWGQYADYPHYKVCDTVDISEYVREGKNELCILAWHFGADSQTYVKGEPGLIYELESEGRIAAWSREGVLCAPAPDYIQNMRRNLSGALGFSYCWNAGGDDGFGREGYEPLGFSAAAAAKERILYVRPNQKLTIGNTAEARLIDPARRVYDLGRECAGFLHIVFEAARGIKFTVVFGEYVKADGGLMREQAGDGLDFSVSYIGGGKRAEHTSYLRRIGCRYFQIVTEADEAVKIVWIGIIETPYPVAVLPFSAGTALRQRIYDVSVRTLRLCMHEHYEDCPWREQALYALDSRSQMLCGYAAFEGGNNGFARSNLRLMGESALRDGLMPKCFPAGESLPIPAFGLIYVVQMAEYAEHSGDIEFVKARLGRLEEIVAAIDGRAGAGGLVPRINGSWNFYEWSDGLNGMLDAADTDWDGKCLACAGEAETDLALNCFLLLAMQSLNTIYSLTGTDQNLDGRIETLRRAVFETFYDASAGLFSSFAGRKHYSKLCNALALLTGCAGGNAAEIAAKIAAGHGLSETTLAMKIFEYDALLSVDQDRYAAYVLAELDRDYGYMLDCGATSFWETLNGYREYGGAGSLCHGWSALPVYYYRKLLQGELWEV